jgi:hypothetical protein
MGVYEVLRPRIAFRTKFESSEPEPAKREEGV